MSIRLPRERESKVQRSVIVRLSRLGIKLWRRNVGGITAEYHGTRRYVRFGAAGQSDLWGLDQTARHWEIETKRQGGKPTPAQLAWLKDLTVRGAVAYWGDSANVIERVAEAVLQGGKIVWHEDHNFDIEMRD